MNMNWNNPRNSVQPTHLVIVPHPQQNTWAGLNPTPPVYNYNYIDPLFIPVSSFVGDDEKIVLSFLANKQSNKISI